MKENLNTTKFTIDDIHRIREINYEKTKGMSMEEKIFHYNNMGKNAEREINRRKSTVSV